MGDKQVESVCGTSSLKKTLFDLHLDGLEIDCPPCMTAMCVRVFLYITHRYTRKWRRSLHCRMAGSQKGHFKLTQWVKLSMAMNKNMGDQGLYKYVGNGARHH